MPGLFVVQVGAHVADVRIREAHNLPGVAGISENFLVTGEAGVENDFAAAAGARPSRAAVKNSTVFECQDCAGDVLQKFLRVNSYHFTKSALSRIAPKRFSGQYANTALP
jgi:hypothetical protein